MAQMDSSLTGARTTGAATAATVVFVIPVFLAGAVAPQIRSDLNFDVAQLGVAISAFVAAQALLSGPLGGLADRLGGRTSMLVSSTTSVAVCVSVGTLVQGWMGLAACLALAGTANALGQPAASRAVALGVRRGRQGLAFGAFQSSKPVAGLLAGLAVPTIALHAGWRAAFLAAAGASAVVVLALLGVEADPHGQPASGHDTTRLPRAVGAPLIVAISLGFAAAKVFSSFLADAGVVAGLGLGTAGLLVATSGGIAVTSRLAVGALADRREGSQLGLVAAMLASGAFGFAMLATGRPAGMVVGTVLVAAGAWGYNGLFYLSITRLMPTRPATGTGIMLSGASVGGAIGPVVFGAVAERTSYGPAWTLVAIWVLLAALCMRQADIRLRENAEWTMRP